LALANGKNKRHHPFTAMIDNEINFIFGVIVVELSPLIARPLSPSLKGCPLAKSDRNKMQNYRLGDRSNYFEKITDID
jgi:hypothetical protein